jgi:fatty-acyl-CoA synthase
MLKTSFSTLGCPSWNFKEIVACASDLGYNGIEIRGINSQIYAPHIPEFCEEHIKNTLKELKNKNLTIPVFSSGANLSDKENIEECLKEAYDYIELSAKCGVKYVRVLCDNAPEAKEDIDCDFVSKQLKIACEKAKKLNVSILIETNGYFAKSDNILKLIEAVNTNNLGIIWDVHHPYTYFNEEPEYTYNKLKKHIRHIHIKDSAIINGIVKYQMLGYGEIPIKQILTLLKNDNFKGYLSLEWVKRWSKDLDDPDIVFPQYIYTIKRLLK